MPIEKLYNLGDLSSPQWEAALQPMANSEDMTRQNLRLKPKTLQIIPEQPIFVSHSRNGQLLVKMGSQPGSSKLKTLPMSAGPFGVKPPATFQLSRN